MIFGAGKPAELVRTSPEVSLAVLPTAQSETPVPPKSATEILAQETGARSPCAAPDALRNKGILLHELLRAAFWAQDEDHRPTGSRVPSFCSIGAILPSRPARSPCRRAQRRSRMARLRATASAARSVLDGREHDGMLDRVGAATSQCNKQTIKRRPRKTIKKRTHAHGIRGLGQRVQDPLEVKLPNSFRPKTVVKPAPLLAARQNLAAADQSDDEHHKSGQTAHDFVDERLLRLLGRQAGEEAHPRRKGEAQAAKGDEDHAVFLAALSRCIGPLMLQEESAHLGPVEDARQTRHEGVQFEARISEIAHGAAS